jgi:tRNA(Ser,Leu) C12 N-acetylase TAN1
MLIVRNVRRKAIKNIKGRNPMGKVIPFPVKEVEEKVDEILDQAKRICEQADRINEQTEAILALFEKKSEDCE